MPCEWPPQLVGVGWRVVLGFQALCNGFVLDVYRVEDFSALYMIRRTKEVAASSLQNNLEKLITNLVDIDHGWRDTIIRVSRAWETIVQKDRGIVPTA